MFGKGNLVIVDDSMKILLAYKHHKFADRSIGSGMNYVPPKKTTMREIKVTAPVTWVYRDSNHKVVDYSFGEMPEKYKDLEKQQFASLSEALDRIYYEEETSMRQKAAGSEASKKEIEIRHSIEKQEKIIKEAITASEESRKTGEIIFSNMSELNKAIEAAKLNKRITAEELASRFPRLKIKRIDLKKKTFTITIE
jgi:predicted ribosome quality control (RQC) complex YloA/Tae2 family protein